MQESLFLRYLPLPLIRLSQTVPSAAFIEIFKSESFEKPTLIWNSEMRGILKESILDNA